MAVDEPVSDSDSEPVSVSDSLERLADSAQGEEIPEFPCDGLKYRERRFVEEYLIDLNGAKAALRAGYAKNTATAFPFLVKPHIAAAIRVAIAQRSARIAVSQETVISETAALALSRIDHYVMEDEGQVTLAEGAPLDAMAAVQSIKRKVRVLYNKDGEIEGREYDTELRLWDKVAPLRLLGKHVGLFPDKVELTGKDGGPIRVAAERLAQMSGEELEQMARALGEAARTLPA